MAAKTTVLGPRDPRNLLRTTAYHTFEQLLLWVSAYPDPVRSFEPALWLRLCALGTTLFQLFLAEREARLAATTTGPRATVSRLLHTIFGAFRFARTYVRLPEGGGFFPLDRDVGLRADIVSPSLAGLGARLATRMSFENASDTLGWLLPRTIPTSTLQKIVLGLGAHTQHFLETMTPPEDDGEVAVAMVDGKCIPTATEAELRQRRGTRKNKPKAASPRHRRRQDRLAGEPRRRRRPGDKAKNGRQVVVVVVYTLQRKGDLLLGPLNKRVFSVVGPKELGFIWLRTELERRGFGPKAKGKHLQFVSDGDEDLQELAAKYIPHAKRTLDLYHGLEYVADAGRVLFPADQRGFDHWFQEARGQVMQGRVGKVLETLRARRREIAKTGPGTKHKRETLDRVVRYLEKRVGLMNYAELAAKDLEIGSGAVEGTVKYLVSGRFDHGGMRWVRERANALLQLRCVEENGEWEKFLAGLFDGQAARLPVSERMLRTAPVPLPTASQQLSAMKNAA